MNKNSFYKGYMQGMFHCITWVLVTGKTDLALEMLYRVAICCDAEDILQAQKNYDLPENEVHQIMEALRQADENES